ncbi:MAG: hypothetical protein RLO17_09505 [Cyclobacteriaceae bacterium]
MYVNRITFEKPRDCVISDDELYKFNRITGYFEELVLNNLPKKVNLGGFGFFHNRLFSSALGNDDIKAYGQIIDFNHRSENFNFDQFIKLSDQDKIIYLLKLFQKAINVISEKYEIDKEKFSECIERSLITGLSIEQKLKVSKYYKNRKIKVDIIRVIEPSEQTIKCRLLNDDNKLLAEFNIERNSTVYNASYNFRKSSWRGTVLSIYDRFERVYFTIDINKYL